MTAAGWTLVQHVGLKPDPRWLSLVGWTSVQHVGLKFDPQLSLVDTLLKHKC